LEGNVDTPLNSCDPLTCILLDAITESLRSLQVTNKNCFWIRLLLQS